ncbi:MAG TPA: hypothetical protein VMW42_14395 [Desulfatiglandales bacterium]|nr:hypothetical protein [Desulfatiglandales bacterium]
MKQILQNLKSGTIELAEVPTPQLKEGYILVQSGTSLISAGTERMLVEFGKANLLEKANAGVFVEPENPDALAQAVIKLYSDPGLRQNLGHNGRKYIVRHLSRGQTAKEYTVILEKVVLEWRKKSN